MKAERTAAALLLNRHRFSILAILGASVLSLAAVAHADTLDTKIIAAVDAATFEVVVPKPTQDPLRYEKPLPLDLLPYAMRNDRYYSIGTAFAIAPNEFVSAAHVLGLGVASQFATPRLRDKQGHVYEIDRIRHYASHQDFVVFSLKDKAAASPLAIDTHPHPNSTVYAVGNALGQGVVIREGLYTSDTPEARDGQWQWIRFSAAASPGNSGGPLLDQEGKIIGVVLGKSPNENLNYALPIAEVTKARDDAAVIDDRIIRGLDNADARVTGTLKKEFALPRSYTALSREMLAARQHYDDTLLQNLLATHRESLFPHGDGAAVLLHSVRAAPLPRLIAKEADGSWRDVAPTRGQHAELAPNGHLAFGVLGNTVLLRVQKPDDIPLRDFYADSKLYLDTILRGFYMDRPIGPERIKIVSLGRAQDDYVFVDSYQRKWQVRTWPVGYEEAVVLSFALPVPGGYVVLLRSVPTARLYDEIADLKVLCDFIYLSYEGSLEQWREFLKEQPLLPAVFAKIDIAFEYDRYFRYRSERCAFSYDPRFMKITPDSGLMLEFSYFTDRGRTVWDVSGIAVSEDRHRKTSVTVLRNIRPSAAMGDRYRSAWQTLLAYRHPFDEVAFPGRDGTTVIGTVNGADAPATAHAAAPLIYTTFYKAEGRLGQVAMQTQLHRFTEQLQLREP